MDKRGFLKTTAALTIGAMPLFNAISNLVNRYSHLTAREIARNESFWKEIRAGYRLKPDYINLENGFYCFMPEELLEAYIHHLRHINYEASYYLRNLMSENKDKMAAKLARFTGCDEGEVIITRNTTESLDIVINGIDWRVGDEAVMANQEYFAMLHMFDQMSDRYGMVNRRFDIPLHPKSDVEIVDLYADAITPKTRIILVSHMINLSGQILPVRKIADMAHSRGVEIMVDGAHTFAHLDFKIPDLQCDYFGTSLHKWLTAPMGSGLLYVKSGKSNNLWPLIADGSYEEEDDIRRLNHTGTHPVATDLAIANALEYLERIGMDRKEARLRYLQEYWTTALRDLPGIKINTPAAPHRACGIANVGVEGIPPKELAHKLLSDYRIWTVGIDAVGIKGTRVTPNIYTSKDELNELIRALKEISNN